MTGMARYANSCNTAMNVIRVINIFWLVVNPDPRGNICPILYKPVQKPEFVQAHRHRVLVYYNYFVK